MAHYYLLLFLYLFVPTCMYVNVCVCVNVCMYRALTCTSILIVLRRRKTMELMRLLPLRAVSLHVGIGPGLSLLDLVLPVYRVLLGPHLRQRFIIHHGCVIPCLQEHGMEQRACRCTDSWTIAQSRKCPTILSTSAMTRTGRIAISTWHDVIEKNIQKGFVQHYVLGYVPRV